MPAVTGLDEQNDRISGEEETDFDSPSSAPPPPAKMPKLGRPALVFLLVVSGIAVAMDLGSKFWAVAKLSDGSAFTLSQDTLALRLAYNPGGAFSMLASADSAVRQLFFIAVNIFAIYFILRLYRRLEEHQRALRWGLSLVLGGALGNFADRLGRGHVIDFIEYRSDWVEAMNGLIHRVHSGWFVTDHWPTFNLADVWIVTGVVLILLDSWKPRRQREKAGAAPAPYVL